MTNSTFTNNSKSSWVKTSNNGNWLRTNNSGNWIRTNNNNSNKSSSCLPTFSSGPRKKLSTRTKWIILISMITVVVLAAAGLLVYFLCFHGKHDYDVKQHVSFIGKGFYLNSMDLLSDNFQNGKTTIMGEFNANSSEIDIKMTAPDFNFFEKYIDSKQSLESESSSSFGLSGSATFANGALSATFSSQVSSWSSEHVHKTRYLLHISRQIGEITLDTGKLPKLDMMKGSNDPFIKAFRKLPREVPNAHQKASWAQYESFLQSYGSHYISSVQLGAKVLVSVETTDKAKTDKNLMQTAACGSYNSTDSKYKSNLCYESSSETRRKSQEQGYVIRRYVRGGNPDLHVEIQGNPTGHKLDAFLDSAASHPGPIGFKFKSITDRISELINHDDYEEKSADLGRLKHLKAYYDGFVSFDCNGPELRKNLKSPKFVWAGDHFKCERLAEGCHHDDDCHYDVLKCYCHGASCVEDFKSSSVRKHPSGAFNEGLNNSCHLRGFTCYCDADGGYKEIWPSLH